MQEDTCKKIRESFRFKESGEEIYVEIGMKNVPSGIETGALIDFFKTLFDETIGQLNDPVIPDTRSEERPHGLSVGDEKVAVTLSGEEFERLMQEWIQKHHRTSFVTDAALDKGQAEGSSQDGEFVSTLRDIKTILERMEGTLSATTLEPGMVVNLTSTCAPGITREDIRTYCRLIQEEFDKMMQDYEKRKSRKTYVGGRGGGVPEMVISIPCPPKGGRDDSSQSHM